MKKIVIIILFLFVGRLSAINPDSLFNVANNKKDYKEKVDLYLDLLDEIYLSDSIYSCVIDSLNSYTEYIENDTTLAKIYFNIGSYQNFVGNYDSSRTYLIKAIEIYSKQNDTLMLAATWGEKGNSFCYEGIYDKCLECFLKSLDYTEQLNSTNYLAVVLNNIGNVYYFMNDYQSALTYFQRSFNIYSKDSSDYGIALSGNNIGSIYLQKENLDSAYYYFTLSLKHALKIDYIDQLAETNSNLAQVFTKKKNFSRAEVYAKKAIVYTKKMQTDYGLAKAYWAYSEILLQMNKLVEAKKYADSTIMISEKGGFLQFMQDGYFTAFKIDSLQGNLSAALKYYILYSNIKDSIINEESSKQIANLQSVYELKQSEKENELLKVKQAKQDEVIKKQRIITAFASIAIILVIIILFIVLRLNRIQKKYNNELVLKNNEINLQKEEITTQNEALIIKNNKIEEQSKQLNHFLTRMRHSVSYAQRIQNAVLSDLSHFEKFFSEYFLIYLPKDVVSGDFYFFVELDENKKLIAVGDSTGHGVPGALMSILNMSILREIVRVNKNYTAAEMLQIARKYVIDALSKESNKNILRDGMDIGLLICDSKEKKINYAGANRPLICFRKDELEIIKGDKQPVAEYIIKKDFSDNYLYYENSLIMYLFSDGYYDQMSEVQLRKFYFSNFKKLLKDIYNLPMKKQKEILLQKLEEHKGSRILTDDITVLGLKI